MSSIIGQCSDKCNDHRIERRLETIGRASCILNFPADNLGARLCYIHCKCVYSSKNSCNSAIFVDSIFLFCANVLQKEIQGVQKLLLKQSHTGQSLYSIGKKLYDQNRVTSQNVQNTNHNSELMFNHKSSVSSKHPHSYLDYNHST